MGVGGLPHHAPSSGQPVPPVAPTEPFVLVLFFVRSGEWNIPGAHGSSHSRLWNAGSGIGIFLVTKEEQGVGSPPRANGELGSGDLALCPRRRLLRRSRSCSGIPHFSTSCAACSPAGLLSVLEPPFFQALPSLSHIVSLWHEC